MMEDLFICKDPKLISSKLQGKKSNIIPSEYYQIADLIVGFNQIIFYD